MDNFDAMYNLRSKGIVRGLNTGFKCLDELYSIKPGTYTFFYAEPTHGKSEIIFELILNQAERYGKRALICSPETGTVDEIIAELIHKYTGKKIYKSDPYCISDKEFVSAMEWLSSKFIIVDTDIKSYSIKDLFDLAKQWENEHPNEKIDIVVGEPYNELRHDMSTFGARQDLYIEDLISEVRTLCRTTKKHFMLSIHPSGSAVPITKDGIVYYPKPLPRQAAGGQALYRKAMTWITLWRPPAGLTEANGWTYKDNEVHLFVDKAKPKGVSTKGKCILYFDWKRNRYSERIESGYAFDHERLIETLDLNTIGREANF